jgi:hypothetical protein
VGRVEVYDVADPTAPEHVESVLWQRHIGVTHLVFQSLAFSKQAPTSLCTLRPPLGVRGFGESLSSRAQGSKARFHYLGVGRSDWLGHIDTTTPGPGAASRRRYAWRCHCHSAPFGARPARVPCKRARHVAERSASHRYQQQELLHTDRVHHGRVCAATHTAGHPSRASCRAVARDGLGGGAGFLHRLLRTRPRPRCQLARRHGQLRGVPCVPWQQSLAWRLGARVRELQRDHVCEGRRNRLQHHLRRLGYTALEAPLAHLHTCRPDAKCFYFYHCTQTSAWCRATL